MFPQQRNLKTKQKPIIPSSVEARILGLTQKAVKHMPHLVEEGNDIVVSHQSWFVGCWLGKVGNHGSKGIAALSTRQVMTRKKGPNSRMRVLRS